MPFTIIRNDITEVAADAIVNTANPKPVIGGGTDYAIHKAAGPELLEARKKIGEIHTGQSVATPAFQLSAKYVLHTVSPAWIDGKHREEELLRKAYDAALQLAEKLNCKASQNVDIANECDDVLYIKSDGSLDSGMELVSHPCSLKYHRQKFPWEEIMHKAIRLGYRSHNTSTCGLHVHIGRKQLGEYIEEQEDVISRILFFFESHWNELFKFSRRSEYSIDRWAARQGYSDRPKDILEKAKTSSKGRYSCVNVTNYSTVEIRMFRGTLKYNTFIATLELVDSICENAVKLTDEEMHKQSWNDFVMSLDPDYEELVQYLKERRLYVNEPIIVEEEV